MNIKRWNILEPDQNVAAAFAQGLSVPPIIADLLASRGHTDLQSASDFLHIGGQMHDPYLLCDMAKAVERIRCAVEEGEHITIYGDYDCDGVTATAMLWHYLDSAGASVDCYIPRRDLQGYGLGLQAIDELKARGTSLVITVDNGISAFEEVEYAAKAGMDVVITDHHTPREELPGAAAIINPHRSDCAYPFTELAGVGVAFKLICALEEDLTCEETLEYYGDMLALGTIADVVPLTGENRIFASRGLHLLTESPSTGIAALLEVCGLGGKNICAENVSFMLAPRINAVGRLEDMGKALELLICEDEERALALAREIEDINLRRKELERGITAEIEAMLGADEAARLNRVIVLCGEGWHPGVLGIVASRIADKYGKPCILLTTDGNYARGSARSVAGFSIIKALAECACCLTQYGGHEQAAGLTLAHGEVERFRTLLLENAARDYYFMPVPTLDIDGVLGALQISLDTAKTLALLEPFGAANCRPVFMIPSLRIEQLFPLGDGSHLRLRLAYRGNIVNAVYFGMSKTDFPYTAGDMLDIAATLSVNEYGGDERVSVQIRAARLSGADWDAIVTGRALYDRYRRGEPLTKEECTQITPSSEDMAVVYRYLRRSVIFSHGEALLCCRIKTLPYGKVRLSVDILEELKLLHIQRDKNRPVISLVPNPIKTSIEKSMILRRLHECNT